MGGLRRRLLDPYKTLLGFESEAKAIYAYDVLLLHGLLQTNEYASAVIRAVSVGERPDVIEQRLRSGWPGRPSSPDNRR